MNTVLMNIRSVKSYRNMLYIYIPGHAIGTFAYIRYSTVIKRMVYGLSALQHGIHANENQIIKPLYIVCVCVC